MDIAVVLIGNLAILQAYVQQLENSRLKLTQLEQELQRARQQVTPMSCRILQPCVLLTKLKFA